MRKAIATCLYLGTLPLVPGTFGTLPAVLLFVLLSRFKPWGEFALLGAFLVLLPIAVRLADWATQQTDNDADPRWFVLDEFVGFLAAALFLGADSIGAAALVSFIAFRLFDIAKPFPIGRVESLGRGWGVVMDDVVAGVYANIAARLIISYFNL